MSTAEQLAFSVSMERRGIHVLLWNDQNDLVRALLVFFAALEGLRTHSVLVSDDEEHLLALRRLVESRVQAIDDESRLPDDRESLRGQFWILFVQQASSNAVGPWLNGWRRPISEPPGAMLVIRHADFNAFQRNAPDIASFVGSRIFDASTMLSLFSKTAHERLSTRVSDNIETILTRLPGTCPDEQELANWIRVNAPEED